ncbi:high-affinity choline transporter 1-like [Watersipora subatra]|uniref:high-affinity choline transporter 1-like n=1 Tax=Watersipora subatra TaxID=2589382 RepID=UPI00355B9DB3
MIVNVGALVTVAVCYVVILVLGILAGRKAKHSEKNADTEEVMLAGRNIGKFVGVFTMTATWVGGGYINGTAEMVYAARRGDGSGLIWVQAPVGFAISLVLGGLFYAKKMRSAGYVTMIDPLSQKFGDRMGALLVLPALCGEIFWSASILSALGSSLAVIIGLETWLAIIVSAAIALCYTVLGGLYSVAYTDIIQLIFMFIGLVLAIPFALTHDAVSPITETSMYDMGGWKGYLDGVGWGLYIDFALLLIFGGIPWQVYFQRVLSSKTVDGARVLSFLGAIGCIVMAIPPVLIGAAGYSADWNQTDYASSLTDTGDIEDYRLVLPLVLQYLTPPAVAAIGLGAVSAAVMSSADSSMLSSSCLFARNIWKLVFRPNASEREIVWVMRGGQLVFCIIATVMAIYINSIYGLFVLCADFVYVVLFPQLTLVLYVPWTNTYGSLSGYIISLLLRLLGGESYLSFPAVMKWPWYDEEYNTQYFPFRTSCMLIGLLVILMVSYLFKRLFESGTLDAKYDIFNAVVNERKQKHEYSTNTSYELSGTVNQALEK